MKQVIIILGPTASGKTKLAIDLAKEINGSIISADSMQVYKYMDIGTAKPTIEEQDGIPHFLLDEVLPSEEFSVARFRDLAIGYIEDIFNQGRQPIIVGGTGLYISVLLQGIEFSQTETDWELRKALSDLANVEGNEVLWNMLEEIDVESAKRIHFNDRKRIIRAIEVFQTTGRTMTEQIEQSKKKSLPYSFIPIGLQLPRDILYKRINDRVDQMVKSGIFEEVRKLQTLGYANCKIPMQALGYKEILMHFEGKLTFEESIEKIKTDTRRFAKRQLSWFRRVDTIFWLDTFENKDNRDSIKKLKEYIERCEKIK